MKKSTDSTEPQYPCISCTRIQESAAAALASIAHFHGVPLAVPQLRLLLPLDSVDLDEVGLLVASRQLGFDSVPLEGEYDDLPAVARPNILVLQAGEAQQKFVVV